MRVTYHTGPLSIKQTFDRHMSIFFDLAEPIRHCVRWRTQVFKIEGFVCKRFLPSPPPPPSFSFWLSFQFSLGQNRKSPSPVFLCPKTWRKRSLRRLVWNIGMPVVRTDTRSVYCHMIGNFFRMDRFTLLWGYACAPFARAWSSAISFYL